MKQYFLVFTGNRNTRVSRLAYNIFLFFTGRIYIQGSQGWDKIFRCSLQEPDIHGPQGWRTIFPCLYRMSTYKVLKAGIQYILVFTGCRHARVSRLGYNISFFTGHRYTRVSRLGYNIFLVFLQDTYIQGSHSWDTIFPCFYRTPTYRSLKTWIQYPLVFTGD